MLDDIAKLAAQALGISTAEVNQARQQLLEEQATADARYATTSALLNPEGSTTPITETYSRTQDRLADLRRKVLKVIPETLSLLLALRVAEERRNEADKHRELKWNSEWERAKTGVHTAVRDYWLRLHQHGVHPHYLKQQAIEMIAIVGDLIAWKAKDPRFKDANNPWREVLGIYARRVIVVPEGNQKAKPSIPGTPTRPRHIGSSDKHYMFNEMIDPRWDLAVEAEEDVAVSGIFDCSVYPADGGVTDAVEPKGGLIDGEYEAAIGRMTDEQRALLRRTAQRWLKSQAGSAPVSDTDSGEAVVRRAMSTIATAPDWLYVRLGMGLV